jgi:prephenate dehydratase
VLTEFRKADLNLSDIQSVPLDGKPGYFRFYADVEFNDEKQYENALKSIRNQCEQFRVLGKYVKQEIPQ